MGRPRHIKKAMKQTSKIVLGLAFIVAGIIWILNIIGILPITFSTKGWWALFIIIPCLLGLLSDTGDRVGHVVGIGMGVLLLLAARDVITWNMMWQIGLALMIVGIGIQLLVHKKGCWGHEGSYEHKTIFRDGMNVHRIDSSFGRQNISFAGEKFEAAEVHTSFGGLELSLKGAEIAEQAFIKLNVGFSGVTIIVPDGLAVQISVNSGFGGVSDKRYTKVNTGTPLLIITGEVGFGGVEIRN